MEFLKDYQYHRIKVRKIILVAVAVIYLGNVKLSCIINQNEINVNIRILKN